MALPKNVIIDIYEAKIQENEEKIRNNPDMDGFEKRKLESKINNYRRYLEQLK
jgi:hypothetical protein